MSARPSLESVNAAKYVVDELARSGFGTPRADRWSPTVAFDYTLVLAREVLRLDAGEPEAP